MTRKRKNLFKTVAIVGAIAVLSIKFQEHLKPWIAKIPVINKFV